VLLFQQIVYLGEYIHGNSEDISPSPLGFELACITTLFVIFQIKVIGHRQYTQVNAMKVAAQNSFQTAN